jgi:hypothetical protein
LQPIDHFRGDLIPLFNVDSVYSRYSVSDQIIGARTA